MQKNRLHRIFETSPHECIDRHRPRLSILKNIYIIDDDDDDEDNECVCVCEREFCNLFRHDNANDFLVVLPTLLIIIESTAEYFVFAFYWMNCMGFRIVLLCVNGRDQDKDRGFGGVCVRTMKSELAVVME